MFRLMFCVLIALVLSACDQSDPEQPSKPRRRRPRSQSKPDHRGDQVAAETSAPLAELANPGQLVFEGTTADFGRLTENEERTRRLSFRNGGTTLTSLISKEHVGAPSPDAKAGLGPGRGGVDRHFDPSGEGEQLKYVNIVTDQPELSRLTVSQCGGIGSSGSQNPPNVDQTNQRVHGIHQAGRLLEQDLQGLHHGNPQDCGRDCLQSRGPTGLA